jgi:putative lipoprotein
MIETLALSLFFQAAGTAPLPSAQPTPPPYEGEWMVELIDNIKVMPDSHVTMRIEGTGLMGSASIMGMASCNNYRGSIDVTGTTVKVGELLRTMKTCDAARLSEENDFLALLRDVVRYEVQSRDMLELKTADRKTIVARRRH